MRTSTTRKYRTQHNDTLLKLTYYNFSEKENSFIAITFGWFFYIGIDWKWKVIKLFYGFDSFLSSRKSKKECFIT